MKQAPRLILFFICLPLACLFGSVALAQTASSTEIQVLQRLAEERYAEGDLIQAAATYREIAAKHPETQDQAQALFTAAWLLQLTGNTSEALTTLTDSLELAPNQPFNASLYDRDFELLYQQALDRALRQRHRESVSKTQAAVAEIRAGRTTQARLLLEAATGLDPDNPAALYNLALLDLEAGAGTKALGDFERVVSLSFKENSADMVQLRARALTSMGVIYQQQGRSDDAVQSFMEATLADPSQATAWLNLGLLQFHQSQFDAASISLERAHELLPENRRVTQALARALVESGRAGQAATMLKTHLRRDDRDPQLWQLLGQIERDRGETQAAIEAWERGLQASQDAPSETGVEISILLASVYLEQGDYEAAQKSANQALGWDNNHPEAWTVLGGGQMEAGQMAPAIASLARAAELDPDSFQRQMTLAGALLADNQLAQAEAAYLRALTLDSASTEASAQLEAVRAKISNERAIVAGKARPRKPIAPKKIGLEFAGIDYKDLQIRGALVKQVNNKSPAARAGLRKGDLILWIGDYSVLSDKDFFQYLKRSPPGDTLEIEYLRDGRIHGVELRLR